MSVQDPTEDWSPSTPEIRGLESAVQGRGFPALAIHFWALWNHHDRVMDERIKRIQPFFGNRLRFASCNVDLAENGELCRRCGVANLPALGIIAPGSSGPTMIGLLEPEELILEIEKRLSDVASTRWRSWWSR